MAPPGRRIAALRQQEPSPAEVLEEEFLVVFTTGVGAKTTLSEEIYRCGEPQRGGNKTPLLPHGSIFLQGQILESANSDEKCLLFPINCLSQR